MLIFLHSFFALYPHNSLLSAFCRWVNRDRRVKYFVLIWTATQHQSTDSTPTVLGNIQCCFLIDLKECIKAVIPLTLGRNSLTSVFFFVLFLPNKMVRYPGSRLGIGSRKRRWMRRPILPLIHLLERDKMILTYLSRLSHNFAILHWLTLCMTHLWTYEDYRLLTETFRV